MKMPPHSDNASIGPRLAISVCTRERPQMLRRLIDSYLALDPVDKLDLVLIVLENHTAADNKSLVESYATNTGRPIVYAWEPKLGIPIARNRCLDIAREIDASHIAFVDDDEWFDPAWLRNIWHFYRSQPDDTVVQGVVTSRLNDRVADYYLPFFQREVPITGSERSTCRTGNVLVPLSVITRHGLRFDESRPLAGGTDTQLFHEAHDKGVRQVNCAEAVVFEEVLAERATRGWLMKRNFRIGLTMGSHHPYKNNRQKITSAIRRCLAATSNLVRGSFYLLINDRSRHLAQWNKAAKKLGHVLGAFGLRVDSYHKVETE